MKDNETLFTPIYGTEAQIISAVNKNEGDIYVASDTKKIFIYANGSFSQIGGSGGSGGGGSTSIFWSNGDEELGTLVEGPELEDGSKSGIYYIKLSAIDGDTIPDNGALVINGDGRFFKVTNNSLSQDNMLTLNLIAVSGGGSGGGGGGIAENLKLAAENVDYLGGTYIYGQESVITFIPTSDISEIISLSYVAKDLTNGNIIAEQTGVRLRSGDSYTCNAKDFPISSNIEITITIISNETGKKLITKFSPIKVIEMGIKKANKDEYIPAINTGGTYRLKLNFIPSGSATISEQSHVYIDGIEDSSLGRPISAAEDGKSCSVTIPHLSHGIHKIEIGISSEINQVLFESDRISFEAAWVDPLETMPVIWLGSYDSTVINYENASIPFMVYNPDDVQNQRKSSVLLFKDGVQISELEVAYNASGWEYWDISAIYEVGMNHLSIQNGLAFKNIDIYVTTEGSRNLGLVDEFSLKLNYSSAGRSSSELLSTRNDWTSVTDTQTTEAILRNFNWANNGWVSPAPDSADYKNGAYLSIANGAELTIPMSAITLNRAARENYSFEFRFRVKNVQKYSTLVTNIPTYFYRDPEGNEHKGEQDGLTITELNRLNSNIPDGNPKYEILIDPYGSPWMNDKKIIQETNITSGVICKWLNTNNEGFVIGTQESFFQSPEKLVSVRYKEDEVINLTFVVSADDSLVYIYLNGILSGATTLPPLTSAAPAFTIDSNLVFNSTYCDFDLYRVRLYETGLTMPQVIHNYLSDLHDIAKYDQNQLTLAINDYALSYDLLVDYNANHPNDVTMPYATWKITKNDDQGRETLPYYKGDKRKVDVKFVDTPLDAALDRGEITEWYYYTHCPSYISTGVEIDVQGTSSQGYPRRNYKLKHKKAKKWEFTHGPLAGQSMTKKWYFDKTTHRAIDPSICDIDILVPKIADQGEGESDEAYAARVAEYNAAVSAVEADLKSRYDVLATNFHMDNEVLGTNKFTWKIDYMESSGSYNTGFANLMGNQEHPLYMKHPLEDQGISAGTMRTSVYGFPLLVFHEYENTDQNITESGQKFEYIGRYNMNLDKGSNEYFGFEEKTKNPATNKSIKDIAESWELSDNQGTWCSWKFPTAEARETGFGTLQDGYDDRLEMMQHFEYRYSKYGDQLDAIGAKGKYDGTTTDAAIIAEIGTTNAEKSHYVREKYYNLERLFYWLDSTDTTAVDPTNLQPIIIRQPILDPATGNVSIQKETIPSVTYTTSVNYDGIDGATSVRVSDGVYTTTFTKDSVGYRKAKFRNEFDLHLDKHYCCVYFITTELLLCYDSRGKNMMMSTWGPHEAGGEYIWYPIFYDIDTQLGLNNSGAYLWDYDADVTKDGLFSTPGSVLWTNLYEIFYEDIVNTYRILRGLSVDEATRKITKSLTYANISGAYSYDGNTFNSYAMRGLRPVIAIGLDEYYKYFATTRASNIGYYDTTGTLVKEGAPSFAYCCQGDKILNTELLLRNRLNYIDSWWIAGDYQIEQVKGSSTQMRVSGNRYSETSDKYFDLPQEQIDADPQLAAVNAVSKPYPAIGAGFDAIVPGYDSIPGYKLKPFLKQYVFYYTDEQPGANVKYNDTAAEQDGVWTPVPSDKFSSYINAKNSPNSQLCYIPGMNYLSSMGDLSVSYIDEFFLKSGLRLLDLKLGSDLPGYYNSLIVPSKFELQDRLADINYEKPEESKHKPLLKRVILTGLTALNATIDLAASSKLEEFRALNTPITSVTFANGAPLHTVHLPNTVSSLALIEATDLTRLLTGPEPPVIGDWDASTWTWTPRPADSYRGLYFEGVTNAVFPRDNGKGSALTNVTIQGGKLKYESYKLIDNLVRLKKGASTNNVLKANLTGLAWTPYTVVPYGEIQDGSTDYYLLTDHSTYVPYDGTDESEWETLTLNEKIYTFDSEAAASTITDLSLLKTFRDEFLNNSISASGQQFTNTSGSSQKTVPALTGDFYIDNDSEHLIDEAMISKSPNGINKTYGDLWPDLRIRAKYVDNAYVAKYVQRLDSGKDNELDVIRYSKGENVHPTITSVIPAKQNYDFIGWTENPAYVIVNTDNISSLIANHTIYSKDDLSWLNSFTFANNKDTFVFYAVFAITAYNFNFCRPDGDLIQQYKVNYGSYMTSMPRIWPAIDDSELGDDQTYKFLGWTLDQDKTIVRAEKDAKLVDPTTVMSQNIDRTFYATFVPAGIKENVIWPSLCISDTEYNIGSAESPRYAYKLNLRTFATVEGKVTLPVQADNGYIFAALDVGTYDSLTHIYWDGEPQVLNLETNCCYNCSNLQYFEWPASLRTVGRSAFQGCTKLQPVMLNEGLEEIYSKAFQECFANVTYDLLYIPSTVKSIDTMAFSSLTCGNVNILQVGNSENKNSLSSVATNWAGPSQSNTWRKIQSAVMYGPDNAGFVNTCFNTGGLVVTPMT